jgi:hypothetical protein
MNLGSDEMPEKKKKSNTRNLKIALGIAAVILVPTIGSTLAGSITVSGGSLEFGQGVVTTAACDTTITVTPESFLSEGAFIASSIAVTAIENSACDGKAFKFRVLSGTTPQVIGTSASTFCTFTHGATDVATTATTGGGGCAVYSSTNTGFIFTPGAGVSLAASLIDKITLESINP